MKEFRINFNKEYKLWEACDPEGDGTAITEYVYFRNGCAYATNSSILVRVPLEKCTTFDAVDMNKMDGFRIHAKALRYLSEFSIVKVTTDFDLFDGTGRLYNDNGKPEPILEFHAFRGLTEMIFRCRMPDRVPAFDDILKVDEDREPIRSLGLRTKYIGSLCSAMGIQRIKMRFTQANQKVFIEELSEDEVEGPKPIGVIMPIKIDPVIPGMEDME